MNVNFGEDVVRRNASGGGGEEVGIEHHHHHSRSNCSIGFFSSSNVKDYDDNAIITPK